MKSLHLFLVFLSFQTLCNAQSSWIRINQIGYLTDDVKVAVLVSKDAGLKVAEFELCDAFDGKTVRTFTQIQPFGQWGAFNSTFRLTFSDFNTEGSYFIKVGTVRSPNFRIANDVYAGSADFLLRYMRQQRCGFNPTLRDSCHTSGGYVVYGDSTNPKYQNLAPYPIIGGWHDASDYLQYVPTTATAVFQMLFAYEQHPDVFGDDYLANGLKGKNGIPDILDEAKWGMDWLLLMNPEPNVMFNQVCDDRDHRGMRLPNKDTFTYDIKGSRARPVYRITGKPQGLFKYKNQTEGVASSAAKFSSAFAIGSRIFMKYDENYALKLRDKAFNAYGFAELNTGKCQTAPCRAPYFYEEDDWKDDMALAEVQINYLGFKSAEKKSGQKEAILFDKKDSYSAWMSKDTARHYQFYPFVHLHPYIHASSNKFLYGDDVKFVHWYYASDLKALQTRAQTNPFNIGTPSIWCANNYISAAVTEAQLYENFCENNQFTPLKSAHRDWLFGCNPWGTSMIIGLPNAKIGANTEGSFPRDPHSAFTHEAKIQIDGGLVDGPLRGSIFNNLIGLTLYQPDEFAQFQSKEWVYHDDYGDYSTNEPTMDGTASLVYFLAAQEAHGQKLADNFYSKKILDKYGVVNRLDTTLKSINLVFTGHEFAEGGKTILKVLKKNGVKASFFLTGDFLRNNQQLTKDFIKDYHYIGCHSDKHLLYADWNKRDSTLIDKSLFINDLKQNFAELEKLNIEKSRATVFMPPYEWYNDSTVLWTKQAGLKLINFTSGTGSNADYTTPDLKNYKSSETIYNNILSYEKQDEHGLNGFILLLHIGVGNKRTDKMYARLDDLIVELKKRGYQFQKF
jgi:endoglucanase